MSAILMLESTIMSAQKASVNDLCTAIFNCEREFGLLNRNVAGVNYWPLIRHEVFIRLTEALGLYRAAHPVWQGRSWWRHMEDGLFLLRDLPFNPWNFSEPRPTVVIPHARKTRREGSSVDIYSHRIIGETARDGLLVLDAPTHDGTYPMSPDDHIRRTGVLRAVAKARALRHWPALRKALREDHFTISRALDSQLGLAPPVSLDWLALRVALFREQRALYRSVFRKAKAERLFIVVAYILPEAVAAARDLQIPVFELQHGAISRFHLGYNYPGRPDMPYAPDRLLVFGEFWADQADLPGNTKAAVIGSENVAHRRSIRTSRRARRVVVLSQGPVGAELFDIALGAARAAPEWEFIYRVHPSERKTDYIAGTGDLVPDNFRLSGFEEDFYTLLSSADVQLGVFSTGIFEGMMMGIRTILVPLSGIEHMSGVLDRQDAVLCRTPMEIVERLPSAPCAANPNIYYADPIPSIQAALS